MSVVCLLFCVCACVLLSCAASVLLRDDIGSLRPSWTAKDNALFVNASVEQLRRRCGTRISNTTRSTAVVSAVSTSVPTSFDARSVWSSSCASVGEIRNQGECGSCWAVSAASAMTDRICIASSSAHQPILSAAHPLSCSSGDGCDGGEPTDAWNFWRTSGIVTGGEYGTTSTCWPYPISPSAQSATTPTCRASCSVSSYPVSWAHDHWFGQSAYQLTSVAAAQAELMANGPITAAFTVYSDFSSYASGVYTHQSGSEVGGHMVKLIGWGTDDAAGDYWIAANSWGTDWGDLGGFFWIKRGSDECGIEDDMYAATPQPTNVTISSTATTPITHLSSSAATAASSSVAPMLSSSIPAPTQQPNTLSSSSAYQSSTAPAPSPSPWPWPFPWPWNNWPL